MVGIADKQAAIGGVCSHVEPQTTEAIDDGVLNVAASVSLGDYAISHEDDGASYMIPSTGVARAYSIGDRRAWFHRRGGLGC
jgi:hypothetical protein